MNSTGFPTFILLVLFLAACGKVDDTQDQAPGTLGVPSGTYAVDKSHSYVIFSYLHQDLSYPLLRMTEVDGQLELDSAEIQNSTASIAIAVDSIRTNLDYFDKELASRKFFHADEYPYATFATHNYKALSESLGELTGFVTIRDVTRPIVFSVTLNGAMEHPALNKPVIGFSATGSLMRSDFDLDRFIPAVGDQVQIRVEAEFVLGSNPGSAAAAALATEAVANADPSSLEIVADSGAAE